MINLTDLDRSDLRRIFRRIRTRAKDANASAEAVATLRTEVGAAFDGAFADADSIDAIDAIETVERFNRERNLKPNPLMPTR